MAESLITALQDPLPKVSGHQGQNSTFEYLNDNTTASMEKGLKRYWYSRPSLRPEIGSTRNTFINTWIRAGFLPRLTRTHESNIHELTSTRGSVKLHGCILGTPSPPHSLHDPDLIPAYSKHSISCGVHRCSKDGQWGIFSLPHQVVFQSQMSRALPEFEGPKSPNQDYSQRQYCGIPRSRIMILSVNTSKKYCLANHRGEAECNCQYWAHCRGSGAVAQKSSINLSQRFDSTWMGKCAMQFKGTEIWDGRVGRARIFCVYFNVNHIVVSHSVCKSTILSTRTNRAHPTLPSIAAPAPR
ncbi:hypothetical protein C8R44DRAFT_736545 [Mycena epipterygia]|nr:hypothetical protein C8R44DRAFT_736545 [Mycena epipterygia]